MRKINVAEYEVEMGDGQKIPYRVKESIVEMLFNPERKLSAVELLKTNELAEKVMASNGALLLEEAEYNDVLSACNLIKGFSRNDVEFVKRITAAPKVPVLEKGE